MDANEARAVKVENSAKQNYDIVMMVRNGDQYKQLVQIVDVMTIT